MSLYKPVPLGEVHSELSCILYAVQTGLADLGVTVSVEYNQYTYLGVRVDLWPRGSGGDMKKKIIAVVARLQQGILHDEYDYRFRTISHPPLEADLASWEKYEVCATLDMQHWPHRKPHGWDPARPHVDGSENWSTARAHQRPAAAQG